MSFSERLYKTKEETESQIKELFRNFKSKNFEKTYLADTKALEIEGKGGDVCIKIHAENQWTLKDVRYIPHLKKNLISIDHLDSTGYATKFGKSSWKAVKDAMVVARDTKSRTLYTTVECMNMIVIAESASNSILWHNRLEHIGCEIILEGMKSVDMSPCENYVMSK